ncbi:hypothetical protein [Bifidobacterium avesanii]|uniref:Uncharacterized protein n=1 Tax=Bifidobacterium avesanii TaxID=1798157 RepID=A0A7K3TI10_9BIFI|nr:hypothetical protein [Bifidobacterium avesanii]KAB8293539.1 hypothetical protein DSM100685_0607 [Bifidobacterium avesanii]NEG78324.1 hypothetical protein [Bifidobacterium avesanii]
MKKIITAMTGTAVLLTLCACGSAPASNQQTSAAPAGPTLSSITVTYDGPTDPGTEINDLSNLKIEGQYSDGATKAPEGCELLSAVTLKAATGSLVTVVCGDVTGDVVVTGAGDAKAEE